jgi:hypothetical protein
MSFNTHNFYVILWCCWPRFVHYIMCVLALHVQYFSLFGHRSPWQARPAKLWIRFRLFDIFLKETVLLHQTAIGWTEFCSLLTWVIVTITWSFCGVCIILLTYISWEANFVYFWPRRQAHLHLLPRSILLQLYLHSPIYLRGVVLY